MSKLQEKIDKYWKEVQDKNLGISKSMLEEVCKGIGPSLYKKDAELVAFSSKDELNTIKNNFIKKKLGVTDSDEAIDAVLQKIGERYGKSYSAKKRAIVYCLLKEHYRK